MSRLPNAPLIEVVFELKWTITNKTELDRCQYLHGDLYSAVRKEYPIRHSILPIDMPLELQVGRPTHRFRVEDRSYPLIQIGPGILTVNTIDEKYFWSQYEEEISYAISHLCDVYKFKDNQLVNLSLQYIDFFNFSFEKSNVLNFLSENLKIDLRQSFYKNTKELTGLDLGFHYNTPVGKLNVILNKGQSNGLDGIVMRTSISGNKIPPELQSIKNWLDNAHKLTSTLFKDMTAGDLYQDFSIL